jgi:hypothetical protein
LTSANCWHTSVLLSRLMLTHQSCVLVHAVMMFTGFVAVIRGSDAAVAGGHVNLTDHNNGTYDVTAVFAGKGRQQLAVYVPGVTRRTDETVNTVTAVTAVTAAASTALQDNSINSSSNSSSSGSGSAATATAAGVGYKSRYKGTPAQARLLDTVAAASAFDSHVPGSPFELYVVGPLECGTEQLVSTVGTCGTDSKRSLIYSWSEPCVGGLAMPKNTRIECDAVPRESSLGITIIVLAALTAAYAVMFMVFIYRHRENWVVKYSQVSVKAATLAYSLQYKM